MLDLLHRYRKHVLCIFRPFYENVTGEKENALYALIRLSAQTTTSSFTHYQLEMASWSSILKHSRSKKR